MIGATGQCGSANAADRSDGPAHDRAAEDGLAVPAPRRAKGNEPLNCREPLNCLEPLNCHEPSSLAADVSPHIHAVSAGVGSSAPARDVSRAEVCRHERKDVVGVGIAADHRLREHKPAVDMDVEYAVVAGDDLDCCEIVFVVLEQSRRQTGGVRSRASGDAVLDPDAV